MSCPSADGPDKVMRVLDRLLAGDLVGLTAALQGADDGEISAAIELVVLDDELRAASVARVARLESIVRRYDPALDLGHRSILGAWGEVSRQATDGDRAEFGQAFLDLLPDELPSVLDPRPAPPTT